MTDHPSLKPDPEYLGYLCCICKIGALQLSVVKEDLFNTSDKRYICKECRDMLKQNKAAATRRRIEGRKNHWRNIGNLFPEESP